MRRLPGGRDSVLVNIEPLESRVNPDANFFAIAGNLFTQDWSDPGLITADADWSGVSSLIGFRGAELTTMAGVDPATVLADPGPTATPDVTANQSDPSLFSSGGLVELDGLSDPVVAFRASEAADAPYLLLHLDTSGVTEAKISYQLRDLDASGDAVQPVALQYRIGTSGAFTNVAEGFVADATNAGSDLVTDVSALLPEEALDQSQVQVRILTSNAVGEDELVGIDNLQVEALATLPSISDILDQTITRDMSSGPIAFTVDDLETPAGDLILGVTVDNTILFPGGSIVFGGSGSDRTITLTPAAVQIGTATVNVTVTDSDGDQQTDSFMVEVSSLPNARLEILDIPSVEVGQTLTVPVELAATGSDTISLEGFQVGLTWDPAVFTFVEGSGTPEVLNVATFNGDVAGQLFVVAAGLDAQVITAGSRETLFTFELQVAGDAPTGAQVLNLVPSVPGNPNELVLLTMDGTPPVVLDPEPTDAPTDEVDGVVTILGGNNPPVASPDNFTVGEDSVLTVAAPGVLANDLDADDDTLTVELVTEPGQGILDLEADGSFVYVPGGNFNGTDQFTYRLNDGMTTSGTTTVTITVTPVNDPPVNTLPADPSILEDGEVVFASSNGNVIAVSDPDGDPAVLELEVSLTVAQGDLTLATTTGLTFLEGSGTDDGAMRFTGTINAINTALDGLVYRPIPDGSGEFPLRITSIDRSDEAFPLMDSDLVRITVGAVNDAPVLLLPAEVMTLVDTPLEFSDSDTVSFTDVDAGTSPVAMTLSVSAGSLTMETTSGLSFVEGDGDQDVSMQFTGTVANINVALGTLRYTPPAGFTDEADLTISVDDQGNRGSGGPQTDSGTVSIQVNETGDVNRPPIANPDTFNVDNDPIQNLLPGVLANDRDPDGDPLTIVSVTQPSSGMVMVNPFDPSLIYIPEQGFIGTVTFTYTISDGRGGSADGTVTVGVSDPGNNPPNAANDTLEVRVNSGAILIPVLQNDTDPDPGDTISIAEFTQPTNGSTSLGVDNQTLRYAPDPGFRGTDSFRYTITDGRGGVDTASVTVTITNAVDQNTVDRYGIAAGTGGSSTVTLRNADRQNSTQPAFDSPVPGGVRIAVADVNNDGTPDTIVGTGAGVPTQVRVLDGRDGSELLSPIAPFEPTFTGGVYVAAGDFDGDGTADIVISPDQGGGPRVRVFRGSDQSVLADFFGIEDPAFRGGARPAVGDLNGDGTTDLIVAAGFLGGPRMSLWDGASLTSGSPQKLIGDFFVFEQSLRNGAFVTAGDVDGDGQADLIVGGGPGGGPRVRIFSGDVLMSGNFDSADPNAAQIGNFFAGDPSNRGGIRLAAKDLDGDEQADLVTAAGTGASPEVVVYRGSGISAEGIPEELDRFTAFAADFTGGVFVG